MENSAPHGGKKMLGADPLLEELRSQVAGELGAVRPLASPWRRALAMMPVWAATLIMVLAVFGLRRDYPDVGPWGTWGITAVQLLIALAALSGGLRLSIPGYGVPVSSVWFLILGLAFGHLAGATLTYQVSPSVVEPGREWQMIGICFAMTLLLGLAPLAGVIHMVRKGLVSRPELAGTLIGMAVAVAGEAQWRLHCPYSSWDHVLAGHTFAILVMAALVMVFGRSALCRGFRNS